VAKHPIPQIEGLSKDTEVLHKQLFDANNLAVVLVGTGFVDSCLAAVLDNYLVHGSAVRESLLDHRGPLGTFFARNGLCYCLGLYPKALYQDLATIGEIRNRFAHHHLALTFDTPEVSKDCEKLSYALSASSGFGFGQGWHDMFNRDARQRFIISVTVIAHTLLQVARTVKPPPAATWPPRDAKPFP
jgi:DNA-binding MltR family transcriptional regulator